MSSIPGSALNKPEYQSAEKARDINKTISDNGVAGDMPQCADMTASAVDNRERGSDVETPEFQG